MAGLGGSWRVLAGPFGVSWQAILVGPHAGDPPLWGGGERLGLPSCWLSPHTGKYSFLPRSPYLHDISPIFLLLYSPLDTALLFGVNATIG